MNDTVHRIRTEEPTTYPVTGAQTLELSHTGPDDAGLVRSVESVNAASYLPVRHPTHDMLFTVTAHLPTELVRGDLLVTDQANGRVRLVRDGIARPYLDVSSWCNAHLWDTAVSPDRSRVFVSLSGMRGPIANHVGVAGTSAVLVIDTATGRLVRSCTPYRSLVGTPYPDRMLDLAGIVALPDGRTVLGCDFNNWQGDGKVVAVDVVDGDVWIVARGLEQPSSLALDGPDHLLVADTWQPHGKASGGRVTRVGIRDGSTETLATVEGVEASLIGVGRLADGTIVGTMSEGTQDQCVVVRIDPSGAWRPIWHPKPGFLGSGISVGDEHLWVAETLRARVYRLDGEGTVLDKVQVYDQVVDPDDDPHRMIRGFDSLESVTEVH